jgi:hypothetical protein
LSSSFFGNMDYIVISYGTMSFSGKQLYTCIYVSVVLSCQGSIDIYRVFLSNLINCIVQPSISFVTVFIKAFRYKHLINHLEKFAYIYAHMHVRWTDHSSI